jgi:hypothetical protein
MKAAGSPVRASAKSSAWLSSRREKVLPMGAITSPRALIMTDDGEASEAQGLHDFDQIEGHRALRVGGLRQV